MIRPAAPAGQTPLVRIYTAPRTSKENRKKFTGYTASPLLFMYRIYKSLFRYTIGRKDTNKKKPTRHRL